MPPIATLTSKGQVTVPKEIRDALGLKPRDRVEIFVKDGAAWMRKAGPASQEGSGGMSQQVATVDASVAKGSDGSSNA